MFRKLNVLHGWLGIAGGLMLLIWYATGIGEHWRYLPSLLSLDERRQALGEPFAPTDAAKSFTDILTGLKEPAREVHLRRAGSRLVYDVRTMSNRVEILDAQTGESLVPVSESFARDIAQTFLPGPPVEAAVLLSEPDTYSNAGQYRITFGDFGKTRVYVSAANASLSARARMRERWNRLLASYPHTFNFPGAFFRRNPGVTDVALLVLNTLVLLIVASGVVLSVWRMARSGFLDGKGLRFLFVRKWHYLLGLVF